MIIIDLSINLEETSTIIIDFIRTYVQNSGCKRVVLGLSGGIDSSVAAVLCKEALGKNNVLCLFMPDDVTPSNDKKHQEIFVKKFDLQCRTIEIASIVQQIQKTCFGKTEKMTLSNIKARTRMILLYTYANEKVCLVCGTSNKSELLIGYFTKYGDGGADLLPIGDIYKTQIYQLAEYLKIPKSLISKAPTAGLWPGQTDEKELGINYETLDKILYGLELKIDIEDIVKEVNVKKSDVRRIRQMIKKSQHKRRTPLIPKLGVRTPGVDWRVPTQEG